MTSRALRRTATLAAALLLTACSSDGGDPSGTSPQRTVSGSSPSSQAACDDVVDGVVGVTQRYVDQYGNAVADGRAPQGEVPDLEQELERARAQLDALGCDAETTTDRLTSGLEGLRATGPLAEAVRARLVASMTGRVSSAAVTQRVGPAEDLREVLPTLAPGSTVRLAAGEHRLGGTVVLLQGVRLVGAGRGRTTLTSSAPDAAVLALTQDRVDLQDLTLRHVGDRPASLVLGGASASLVLDRVALVGASSGSGAGEGEQAGGGSGVLMAAGRGADGQRGTTLEVTDSVFRANDAAGILLSGGHVASVVGSSFVDNGQCGVCFVGTSSGLVRDAQFAGGVTGLIAADRSTPLLADSTVRGPQIGVQAVDRATPIIRRTAVIGARRIAVLFADRSRGRVEAVTCRDSRFGIVVAPTALPFIGETGCTVQPTG